MAIFTKPAKVPRWADTTANILEPMEAKKDLGWVFGEEPSSAFENQRTKLNGDWWKWIDERWADGVDADEIALLDPDTTAVMTRISALKFQMLQPVVVGAASPQDAGDLVVENGLNVGGATNPASGQGTFVDSIHVGSDVIPTAGVSKFLGGMNIGTPANNAAAGKLHLSGGIRAGTGTTSPSNGGGIFSDGLVVGFDDVPASGQVRVGDNSYALRLDGSNPTIDVDVGDRMIYDRAGNFFDFIVGGSSNLRVTGTNVKPNNDFIINLGNNSGNAWGFVFGKKFVPEPASDTTPNQSRFEYSQNNAISMKARITSGGATLGDHWNAIAADVTVTGEVLITVDEDLGSNGHIVCTIDSFGSPVDVCQGQYESIINDRVEIRIMDLGGTLRARNISVVGFN